MSTLLLDPLVETVQEEAVEIPVSALLAESRAPGESRSAYEARLAEVYRHTPYYSQLRSRISEAARIGFLVEIGALIPCDKCGHLYGIGEWYDCASPGGHGRVRPRNAQTSSPTVYYFNPRTRKIWIPGRNDRRPPKGYVKEEVSYWGRKQFYRMLDNEARETYFKRIEREEKIFGPLFAENRKQLRQDCKTKEWVEHAIEKTERAQHAKLSYSPNTIVEAWEYDQSNLDDARGPENEHLEKVQPKNFKPKPAKRARSTYRERREAK